MTMVARMAKTRGSVGPPWPSIPQNKTDQFVVKLILVEKKMEFRQKPDGSNRRNQHQHHECSDE